MSTHLTDDYSIVSHVEEIRAPGYFRTTTTLSQIREKQRQRRIKERKKEEKQFERRAHKSSHKRILVEEVKPKKRLSQQIREEEVAIKEMQQLLVELDEDETEVLKKMQELNNRKIKLESRSIKDTYQYVNKSSQLNEVILILQDHLHMLKNYGEKIEAQIGFKREKLDKLKVDYEQILSSGITEEDIETEELLRQFYPGISAESGDLEDMDENTSQNHFNGSLPPRCKNPLASQLLGVKSRRTKGTATPLPEILNEYRHTLKRDLALIKKSGASCKRENDGMKKFMHSLMQSENKK